MKKLICEVDEDYFNELCEAFKKYPMGGIPTYRAWALLEGLKNGIVLDGLTNGEIMLKMFPYLKPTYIDEWKDYNNTHSLFAKAWVNVDFGDGKTLGFDLLWWNGKWGE